jgi:hypothetical protein
MDESQDSAAFIAECVTVGPSRADYVQQVLVTARATLARCRANDQFRDQPAEPPGVPEWRSRGRPLAPRDRTQPTTPDASPPTWEQERGAVLEAIRGLREWAETLTDRLTPRSGGRRAVKTEPLPGLLATVTCSPRASIGVVISDDRSWHFSDLVRCPT